MFTRRLAAAIGLLFALVGSQGPEFSQQYRQRLGGALDELKRVVAAFNADAAKQSITPVEAIARLEGNPDPLAQARGAAIESDIARRNKLQNAFDAMRDAGPVQRIGAMAADFDSGDRRRHAAELRAGGSGHFGSLAGRRTGAGHRLGREPTSAPGRSGSVGVSGARSVGQPRPVAGPKGRAAAPARLPLSTV